LRNKNNFQKGRICQVGLGSDLSTTRLYPNLEQQQLLEAATLRLIRRDELERWNQLICDHHYLREATMVGLLALCGRALELWKGLRSTLPRRKILPSCHRRHHQPLEIE
jgi:hypothetical protein